MAFASAAASTSSTRIILPQAIVRCQWGYCGATVLDRHRRRPGVRRPRLVSSPTLDPSAVRRRAPSGRRASCASRALWVPVERHRPDAEPSGTGWTPRCRGAPRTRSSFRSTVVCGIPATAGAAPRSTSTWWQRAAGLGGRGNSNCESAAPPPGESPREKKHRESLKSHALLNSLRE